MLITMSSRLLLVVLLGLITPTVFALERVGFLVRDTPLKSEPKITSGIIVDLKEGAKINVIERSGGWYSVQTGTTQGWLKFIAIRFKQSNTTGSSGLSETAELLTSDTTLTLTAGVKGLQEEDLKTAEVNLAAVELMESFIVTKAQVDKFANQGQLKTGAVK